ncbi:zinc finger matrin-type protein 5 [Myotis lucifugus]|uniref:zinc finger matrin-type protein 5 n=1 Tax=Myotis lucifugus TaxID=59463 RepID=UPI000CCC32BB|nr:zinc finger matrin-type protein 5 [Myotis lucifugus]
MGKRYFCDYCDRSFQDNLHNRKKHLNGLQHLKAKKAWYDMFREGLRLGCTLASPGEHDAEATPYPTFPAGPCAIRWGNGGPERLNTWPVVMDIWTPKPLVLPWPSAPSGALPARAASNCLPLAGQCDFGPNCRFSHMSERDLQELSIQVEEERRAREWPLDIADLPEGHLEDWLEERAKRLSSAPSSRAEPSRATVFQYPVGWPPVQELPPSLRAPPPGGWPLQPRVQWG